MRTRLFPALAFVALVGAPTGASAQFISADDDIVDRVVAIVGDSVVLLSQIEEEIQRLRLTQNFEVPPPGPEYDQLRSEILEQWINQVLILQEAAKDSLVQIDDGLIEERVTEQIETVTQQIGGQAALQQALAGDGLTLAEYRDMFRTQVREAQVREMFLQLRLREARDIPVSEDEMLAAFQAARAGLTQRPKLITFRQVVVKPEVSSASKDSARAEAARVLEQLRAGADFAELATEYSDDAASAVEGGSLGWFRRGAMVREFEDAAFALLDGQTSGIIESEFGYHIIRIERSRPGERSGRHILFRPELTEADIQIARDEAATVAEAVQGGTPIVDLIETYADPMAPDSMTVTVDQVSSLPPGYDVVARASTGDLLGPIEYVTGRSETRIAVISVTEVREAGAYTFEDVRGQLADQLQQQRKIARILEDLRARTHIEIRN